MFNYLSKENIALTLSIISIILSLISFAKTIFNEYLRLRVSYVSHFTYEKDGKTTLFIFMTITNKSRLTVSLSSAFLEINNESYHLDWRPQEVLNESTIINNQVIDRRITSTIPMPHTLMGLGVVGGYFGVETDLTSDFIEEHPDVKLILHTNKKILEEPISLSKGTRV